MATMPFQAMRSKSPPTMPISSVHVLALFRGIDRHLGVAQFVQDQAVEAVVLAEAAGAVGRGHEEGAALGVEVRAAAAAWPGRRW